MTFEIIFVIGGALLIVWGIIRIIMASKGGKMKKFNKDLEDYGFTAASLEADYQSAKNNPNKLCGILAVGQHALYYMDGAHPRMVPTTKLLWAYPNITQHRTYGIPTGKTYSVQVYAEGRGNFVAIGAKNEANAKEILEYLVSRYPWMVVGYSAELSGLYAKDLAAFKSLKYDKEIVNANMF